jgi:N,N-dimethylformamidase beta subunit-like, C-terminal/RTX calcium-binding nonapeptide repeat (4 copies)
MARTSWSQRAARLAAAAAVLLALTVGTATAERVSGTAGGDTIRGTARADRLYGRAGDDRIFGLAGADILEGGKGTDRLWGGPGRDRIVSRDSAQDLVVCGTGRDVAIVDLLDLVHTSCEVVRRPPVSSDTPPLEPSPVTLENRKAGTPGWASFDLAPSRAIEGYTAPSVAPGDLLELHVSTTPAATYRVLVYRAGYYGGVGARRVACLPSCDGATQGAERTIPTPSPEGLVHAGWPTGESIRIPADWVSGYYFAHLQLASGPLAGRVTTTWFVVREAPGARRAPLLVQASATTWQAYNGWGGGSLYEFNSPNGRRAAKVAFDRPYQQPLEQRPEALEVPLARFLERNGYDVSYQADVDTARDPGSLVGRRTITVAGHSEYWSKAIRDSFENARDAGIDLAFFGANAAYWQVRYEDDYRTVVGYKNPGWDPETDPALETNLFRALVPPRGECALMGIQHAGGLLNWTADGDYTVTPEAQHDPWLRRAGFAPGNVVRGIVSREADTIPGNQSAESSCGNKLTVLFHRELGTAESGDADAVRFTAPSGARIFASGSHQFVWGLEDVPEVERMRHGIVDPRLQSFVRAMLDDMLAGS